MWARKAMCFLHWQQLVSTTDALVTNLSTKAQSEQARKCKGLFMRIWDAMYVLGEQIQSINLQGSHKVSLTFPSEYHPLQHLATPRKEKVS